MRFLPGIFSSLRRRAAGAPHCIVNPSDWLPFRVRGHPRKEKKGRGVAALVGAAGSAPLLAASGSSAHRDGGDAISGSLLQTAAERTGDRD